MMLPFFLFGQNRYAVVITEIMADPTPLVGLPNYEWIELRNHSSDPLNLRQWRIGDENGLSGAFPDFIIPPDSAVIICSNSAAAALLPYGQVIAVSSFPSLDNDAELIFLRTATGMTMHALRYEKSWYANELKQEGGWSMEMIDSNNPCSGSNNWIASNDMKGGTPGRKNSSWAVNPDQAAPKLQRSHTNGSQSIILQFDEPLDSLQAANTSHYSINAGLAISRARPLPPLFDQVELTSTHPLDSGKVYQITVTGLKDCRQNMITSPQLVKTGLPAIPRRGQCIINEILFNPRSNAYDYVELYNNSQYIFDASALALANRNNNGIISSIRMLSPGPFYIFPGDYIVLTENLSSLSHQYLVKNPEQVLTLSSLPSLPDDEGTVIILDNQGLVLDELHYKDDWHFKLLANDEGVALERIDPSAPTQVESNWHSAASTAGYGTPTYKNSQHRGSDGGNAVLRISPAIFSPDNDGFDDLAFLHYEMTEPGHIANIRIYDSHGRPVRQLVQNGIMGRMGNWTWDGLDDKGQKLASGTYIILTQLFNLQGKRQQFKQGIVLARHFH
ncbi:MAG TPA: lamin tail domain-containing protein [Chitinophagaceae bacterium]|nr:lamin tail domain-containing protein [Chitinophagaceae bacterium]